MSDDFQHLTDRELLIRVATQQQESNRMIQKHNGDLQTLKIDHYQMRGAVGILRWVIAAIIAASGVAAGFVYTDEAPASTIAVQQVQCDENLENCEPVP